MTPERLCTVVSLSPAMTCALVTTRPGAAGAVGHVHRLAADQARAYPQREALEGHRDKSAHDESPERRQQRRVGRIRALGEQRRRQTAADEGAAGEADKSQRADDQALLV